MTEIFHLTGGVEIQAAAGDQKRPPRVSILAYAGGLMTVPDWGPVILDLSQLDISGAITLLADHENKLRQVVGTGTATVRSGQLFIDGTLTSATEAGRMVLGLHADKVPLQASVGVAPGQQSWLSEGETIHVNGRDLVVPAGGAALIESGKLRETSLTPLGSDSETR
ncbi:MAG: hypothetical protein HQ582_06720, partial [Planctomycetes bacterium]|nr:hypothetical protein [Planctomycetota bacterium]